MIFYTIVDDCRKTISRKYLFFISATLIINVSKIIANKITIVKILNKKSILKNFVSFLIFESGSSWHGLTVGKIRSLVRRNNIYISK